MAPGEEVELESEERLLDDEPHQPHTRSRRPWNYRQIFITIAALLIGIAIPPVFSSFRRSPSKTTAFGDCGSTLVQARAAGCKFDVVSFSWLPPECHEQSLIDDFLELQDWQWYRTPTSQDTVHRWLVLDGAHSELYVTREYHIFHCTYQWKKMHLGLQKRIIDTYIGGYNHTAHCDKMLTEEAPRNQTDTRIVRKFVQCQRI